MGNIIGIMVILLFCVVAISRLRTFSTKGSDLQGEEVSPGVRRKAIFFYGVIIAAVVLYFVISLSATTSIGSN